ncbi:hypothetical protein CRM22_010000 [Opisthorchis felineus]|uniref:Uncharacterized protein n=1 Tax=Opisthorchis felineus TaxID=147828 RepID=A0A4S2LA18_OPIFE|nr:hypothetical protein CRM22_010000 [Opisthorchis felineus]
MTNATSETPGTMLATLSRLQGWLGTLVLSSDGSILQSAGELVNSKDIAQRFAAIANRIGRLINLEDHSQTPEFKRVTGLIAYVESNGREDPSSDPCALLYARAALFWKTHVFSECEYQNTGSTIRVYKLKVETEKLEVGLLDLETPYLLWQLNRMLNANAEKCASFLVLPLVGPDHSLDCSPIASTLHNAGIPVSTCEDLPIRPAIIQHWNLKALNVFADRAVNIDVLMRAQIELNKDSAQCNYHI